MLTVCLPAGPYSSAVLHFQISFPDTYPSLPPLVTFSTDIFHPLITPLTNYMYTTDIQDGGTVSATDEERLPPGGFSLRHGFPAWFGRASRSKRLSAQLRPQTPQTPPPRSGPMSTSPSASVQSTPQSSAASPFGSRRGGAGGRETAPGSATAASTPSYLQTWPQTSHVSTYDVLRYIRSTFDDEAVLDAIPIEAAGNPGAWHAWRTRQRQSGKAVAEPAATSSGAGATAAGMATVKTTGDAGATGVPTPTTRKPGEWNWEHVWEERVRKGIQASLSEAVLFGSAGAADDVVSSRRQEEA